MSNTTGPSTWFSGKSAPEDQKGPSITLVAGLIFLIYCPIGIISFAIPYGLFLYRKISYQTVLITSGAYSLLYLVLVLIISSPQQQIVRYNQPWYKLINDIRKDHTDHLLRNNFGYWFSHQIWLAVFLGFIFASLASVWKWWRRPVWENYDPTPGPYHKYKLKKAIEEISSDINGPSDGGTLGVDAFGKKIVQTEAEAAAHGLLIGGSGSGKTTTMLMSVRDSIRRGEPVCVIDMKGSDDLAETIAEWSQRYGRRFLHWSITDRRLGYHGPADGPAYYDPIGRGDPSRKKDLIIDSEKWDVEYYKSVNENYLQTAFQIADLVPNPQVDAFTDLNALLDMDKLKQRAAALFINTPKSPEGQQHAAAHGIKSRWWEQYYTVTDPYVSDVLSAAADLIVKPEESERSAVRNMAARIQKIRQSTAGAWLKKDPEYGRDIDLRKVADNGWVVLFSLDSSKYQSTSQQLGGLIVQDLNTLSSELRQNPATYPFHVYVDEFSAIGNDNILNLLARARDARMPTILSTQALPDLKKADPLFLDQVLGIVNCFIIHRSNTEADAEVIAGLTGKHWVYEVRTSVEMTSGIPGGIGTGAATGQGHVEKVEQYVVLPSQIQALERGELIYIANSPKKRVINPVQVIRENSEKVALAVAKKGTINTHNNKPEIYQTKKEPTPFDIEETPSAPEPALPNHQYEEITQKQNLKEPFNQPPSHPAKPTSVPTVKIDPKNPFDEPQTEQEPKKEPQLNTSVKPPVIDPAMYRNSQPNNKPKNIQPQPNKPTTSTTETSNEFGFTDIDVDWESSGNQWDTIDLGIKQPKTLPGKPTKPSGNKQEQPKQTEYNNFEAEEWDK